MRQRNALKLLFLIAVSSLAFVAAADSPRERVLMDSSWKFHLGDMGFRENIINAGVNQGPAGKKFNANAWSSVNLPHDWAIELPFDQSANASHGYKPIGPGFLTNSIGWYRKSFSVSKEDEGKRLWLEFDGVYRKCQVFLNGYKLTHHEGGYNSFRCDITDVAEYGGKNVLAVRVDASEFEGWFYEGAGIYRHVWLVKTAPLAIAPDGVFVYSQFKDNVPRGPAEIYFETELQNVRGESAVAKVVWQVLGPDGKVAAEVTRSETVDSWQTKEMAGKAKVSAPVLWSPESPKLYKLITTVTSAGKAVDHTETEFGIRTVAFDANEGFLLNGKHYTIKGTCNHQDHAGVGIGIPDALQYFRVGKLKEMGCNAIRTSHNEPTAELVEACDHLGVLVMDETRNFASDVQALANLEQQIRRDRNHPSVFIWSLGNEEPLQRSEADGAMARTMRRLAHKLDPTRSCTFAMSDWSRGKADGISTGLDVQGFNYFNNGEMDAFHQANPNQPCIGTEEGSGFYTRGIYENTATYKSAFDQNYNGNGAPTEKCWGYYVDRPWVSGTFLWTGFDYRGETTPFGWPNISSEFGILDTCGFPKDVFYFYQSWWTTNVVLHLLPHWNWPDKSGQNMDVWCFSNCKQVELFLNGNSLGKKEMPRNSHLQWNVRYSPGTLSAKGFDSDGKEIIATKVETTGGPTGIKLASDRAVIHGDGADCSVVTVAMTDSQGRVVPTANNLIHFEINGPGKIIGVGNGDPICHEPDVNFAKVDESAKALKDWRMMEIPNLTNRSELAAEFDDRQWQEVNVNANDGPLRSEEAAVFRTHVSLTADDLEASQINLNFGMIDDDGWIYVNGQLVGESHDWSDAPFFDVRKFLHAGDNVIAVAVKNHEGPGGVNKGVSLEFERRTLPPDWHRSAFSGLAQVIIQANVGAGEIQLKASADGIASAVTTIHTAP